MQPSPGSYVSACGQYSGDTGHGSAVAPGLESKGQASRPKLSEALFAVLERELARGPVAHGWPDQTWTLARIKTLIGRRFHKSMTLSAIAQMPHRHGFSHQVPARRPLRPRRGVPFLAVGRAGCIDARRGRRGEHREGQHRRTSAPGRGIRRRNRRPGRRGRPAGRRPGRLRRPHRGRDRPVR
ncbi:winged helix-turn-helix domain-containing protein [Streptomyces sp. NPDC007896]|uniref:helix-turn-helix domain-containing protein n=1 Tax=Streptomyces sp. NPDC007896 TaxID=3364784 RepID=UPI0036EFE61A